LIVNFSCVSSSANLRRKTIIQTNKQAGLSRKYQIYFGWTLRKFVLLWWNW